MRVEQPRHQGSTLAIDDAGIPRLMRRRLRLDPLDPTVLDDEASARLWVTSGAIQDGGVFEDDGHAT